MLKQDIVINLNSAIADIQKKYSDISPILPGIAALIQSSIIENIDAGGRWDGVGTSIFSGGNQKWKPLSEPYKKHLIKKYGESVNTNPTLNRQGYLRSSITDGIRPYGKSSVLIGSNYEYAAVHQFGSKDKSIPARPYITLTDTDIELIINKLKSLL